MLNWTSGFTRRWPNARHESVTGVRGGGVRLRQCERPAALPSKQEQASPHRDHAGDLRSLSDFRFAAGRGGAGDESEVIEEACGAGGSLSQVDPHLGKRGIGQNTEEGEIRGILCGDDDTEADTIELDPECSGTGKGGREIDSESINLYRQGQQKIRVDGHVRTEARAGAEVIGTGGWVTEYQHVAGILHADKVDVADGQARCGVVRGPLTRCIHETLEVDVRAGTIQ